MKQKLFSISLIVILMAVLIAGCGIKSAIIGEWQGTLGTISFDKDGTVTSGMLGIGIQGTYSFVDSDTINISIGGVSTEYNVKISGNTLYLESGGVSIEYNRVK
jgi:hypothetical protein